MFHLLKGAKMSFKYAVALTGGIATGKSTVANIFISFGFNIIDADKISHMILDKNYLKIAKLFGDRYIIDNRVDRKLLGGLIFSDREAKEALEELLHPRIYDEISRLSIEQDSLKRPYLIDIPLFFETNRYPIKRVIVVYTPKKIELKRLIKRDSISLEDAKKRLNAQLDIEDKRLKASYLIDNSRDLKSLQYECDKVKRQILLDFKRG